MVRYGGKSLMEIYSEGQFDKKEQVAQLRKLSEWLAVLENMMVFLRLSSEISSLGSFYANSV